MMDINAQVIHAQLRLKLQQTNTKYEEVADKIIVLKRLKEIEWLYFYARWDF